MMIQRLIYTIFYNLMDFISHTEKIICITFIINPIYNRYLIIHIREHTGEKPYKYYLCLYECKCIKSLGYHKVQHTKELECICVCLDFRSGSKNCDLNHHYNGAQVIYHIMLLSCTECVYYFRKTDKGNLCNHIHCIFHIGKSMPYDKYINRLLYTHNLVIHKIKHNGEKPYRRRKCNDAVINILKLMRLSSNLAINKKLHTGKNLVNVVIVKENFIYTSLNIRK